ncbi:nitrilase-related carbon-nitrogen hydrolase [Acetobacter oryzoeni]|uniref:nitrilase-related carbon-nitrogen hydrolase n=1 Tax=Acetobacter oryzoeni TaxID=2500548 RepID=UPI00142ED93A|nr:nitrilase-related carbon-nitrogen hydrolase [Acetobacter oryzoeni]
MNERDFGTLYNTQIIFDATGEILLKRRKITPTYHERMVWGRRWCGLKVVESAAGASGAGLLGALQSARPLRADDQHEEIHCANSGRW